MHSNCPPWLEKILKYTDLKWLKIHSNCPQWFQKMSQDISGWPLDISYQIPGVFQVFPGNFTDFPGIFSTLLTR